MIGEWLDNLVGWFSPRAAAERGLWRAAAAEGRGLSRSRLNSRKPERNEPDWFDAAYARRRVEDRDAARTLYRRNSNAESLVNALCDNVIGTGMVARSLDPKFAEAHTKWFNRWCLAVDLAGRTLWELQWEWFREAYLCGDAFIICLADGRIQLVGSDQVADPYKPEPADVDLKAGSMITDGVVHTPTGVPLAYYVKSGDDFRRFAARDVIPWVFRRGHPMDVRGTPAFGSTYNKLDQLDQYTESVATAARAAACIGLAITTESAARRWAAVKKDDATGERRERLQPGMIMHLKPGESLSQVNPNQPGPQYDQFTASVLRQIGAVDRVPLEISLIDFRNNFSGSKGAVAQFQTRRSTAHDRAGWNPLRRLYEWRVGKAIADGAFTEFSPEWREHSWAPPQIAYMDEKVEAESALMKQGGNLETFKAWCASRGLDWKQQIDDVAEVQSYGRSKGVTFSASAATRQPDPVIGDAGKAAAKEYNGAQVTAATEIVTNVALGTMPRDSAMGLLKTLLGVTQAQAEEMVGSAGTGSAGAKPPAATPPATPASGESPGGAP